MTEKSELIKQMLELQKKFIEHEQTHGVSQSEYFDAPADHPLHGYRDQYRDIAMRVVELAHTEKGSKR